MRFDVAALRAAVEKALAADRTNWEEARAADVAEEDRQRAAWVEQYGPRWVEAAKVIARKARKGLPIDREDLPHEDRYSQVAYWRGVGSKYGPSSRATAEYRPPVELAALVRVLDTVADETVTSAGLRDLGVGSATVRRCLAHMARASVKG